MTQMPQLISVSQSVPRGIIKTFMNKYRTMILYLLVAAFSKSLSPFFFSIFDKKLSHPWIQIPKKQLNFLRLSMDRKKIEN